MKSTDTNQKKDEKTAAAKKRAAAIKLHAKEIFDSAIPEYIAFFLQNRGMSPDERTGSIIGLAERSIDYAEAFASAWKRKKGKFLAE